MLSFGHIPAGLTNQPLPESALVMHQIEVIGPVNGVYHLGYQVGEKFLSINEFVSKELALWAASRITSSRV